MSKRSLLGLMGKNPKMCLLKIFTRVSNRKYNKTSFFLRQLPSRGWSSHKSWKSGFSMANCCKSTNRLTKYNLSDIFEQKYCIQKKIESDGWLVQSETSLQNWQNNFSKCIFSLSFSGTTMIHDLKKLDRTLAGHIKAFLKKIFGFGFL